MEQRSRRELLGLVGAGGIAGIAGCLGGSDTVSVLSAGSLARVLETIGEGFSAEHDAEFRGEFHGSNVVMQLIEDEVKKPDVAVSADVDLLRDRLYPAFASWDVVFAANEVGLAYNPDTELGARLEGPEPWYEVLRSAEDGAVAISDPELDPLGYRALQVLELAETEYGVDGLREAVSERAYREPDEPRLLTGVETGDRAVAISYRNMAVDRGLAFHELPDRINLSDPAAAEFYATATYTTEDGYTARGSPVSYNATVLDDADNPEAGREFVLYLLDNPTSLETNGLTVPDRLPLAAGATPEMITERVGG